MAMISAQLPKFKDSSRIGNKLAWFCLKLNFSSC